METDLRIPSRNPTFPQFTTLGASLYIPPEASSENSIAIIVHGHAGHRDYCYQKLLSRSLSIPSIRFDYSGCGYQLGTGTAHGSEAQEIARTIASDLVDLKTVIDHVRGQGYFVTALVGHSRGAVTCLQYARSDHTIPTIVNCSGRYRAHLIHEKVRRNPHLTEDATGYWEKHRAGTGGDLVDKWTLLSEIASVGAQEMRGIGRALGPDVNVLIIFGTRDNVVPVADAGMFVNELRERAELTMIDDADHNFFVQPLDRGGRKVNKNQEVADIISAYLSPEGTRQRFLRRHLQVRTPRFPPVEGMSNFRDLGGYGSFPAGVVFRGADLSSLTPVGAERLASYVSTIIDVRSEPEIDLNGTIGPNLSAPLTVAGIERIHAPIFRHVDYSPAGIQKFFGSPMKSEREKQAGMVGAYKSILQKARPVFSLLIAEILRGHAPIHDHRRGSGGVLIHCSAGKDRTGILCAMLLLLAGIDAETVALEYELTTYGLDPAKLQHSAVVETPSDDSGGGGEGPVALKKIGAGSRAETMRLFLAYVTQEIDVDTYFSQCVSADELRAVKALLRGGGTTSKL